MYIKLHLTLKNYYLLQCTPPRRARHQGEEHATGASLSELGIAEAKQHNEITFASIAGKTNLSDLFTKEDNDVAYFSSLWNLMVISREYFHQTEP